MNSNYSESFSTTRLGTIATGYRLSISGDGSPSNLPTGAIQIGEGTSIRRDFEARTTTWVDPLYQKLSRVTIVQTDKNKHMEEFRGGGANFLNIDDFVDIANKGLMGGDLTLFLGKFMDLSNITIKESRVSKARKAFPSTKKSSMNQVRGMGTMGNIISTMDILSTYLPVFGVELYWNGGDNYSIEEPRILHPEVSGGTIKKEDILDKTVGADIYNAPDIIIPRIPPSSNLKKSMIDKLTLEAVLGAVENNAGSDTFKISTFDIPNMLSNAWDIGHDVFHDQSETTTGISPSGEGGQARESIISFYRELAYNSAMYGLASGTITCTHQPDIMIPAMWYDVGGDKVFISDIRHEVSRFRAVTILTVAGVSNGTLGPPPTGGGGSGGGSGGADADVIRGKDLISREDAKALQERIKAKKEKRFVPVRNTNGKVKIGNLLPNKKKAEEKIDGAIKQRIPGGKK